MAGLAGKTALVTGAGRGIGRAIALRLGRDGARVGVHYSASAAGAADTVSAIEASGGQAFAVAAALGTGGDAVRLWSAYDDHADGVDIIVNNAGILGDRVPFAKTNEATYDRVFDVNTKAPFFILQHGLRRLRDGGRIINISTVFTHGTRNAQLLPYAMSKAAIDALTSTLAKDLGSRGITVNAIGPGPINTEMNAARLQTPDGRAMIAALAPLGRVGEPDDIADIAAFLASDDSRWVTGQWIAASGGSLL